MFFMKYRKAGALRVAYGFNGRLQDDLEAYQGFMEQATVEGWQVMAIYEHFERRVRAWAEAEGVDAVVGKFISRKWLEDLPGALAAVHLGEAPLSGVVSVTPDTEQVGREGAAHLLQQGYERLIWFSPRRVSGITRGIELGWGRTPVELRTLDALREWLSGGSESEPAGVFCLDDFHARRVIGLCTSLGMNVPRQVGVLGIGDRFWDGVAAGMRISSMPIPHRRMGGTAARELGSLIRHEAVETVAIAPGEVRARESTRRSSGNRPLVDRVRSWWGDALADPLSVAEVAKRAGMSRRGFERAFAAEAGTTPYEDLLRMRTEAALRLLRETDGSVARVGAEVGIPDPARFSAFMKKRTGRSPKTLRTEWGFRDSTP